MFSDEKMILDIRLNVLSEYIDHFVIVESKYKHDGSVKDKNFNIDEFSKFKNKISFKTDNTVRFVIENNGCGIGTTSPTHTLQIDSNSGVEGLQVNGDANQYVASFRASTTTGQSYGPYVRAGTNSSDAALTVENAAGSTSLLKLTGEGKLGIGVTDPDEKLEVSGAIHISAELGGSDIPSTPAANDGGVLYAKEDGKLYYKSNTVSETDISSGGGGGTGSAGLIAASATSAAGTGGNGTTFTITGSPVTKGGGGGGGAHGPGGSAGEGGPGGGADGDGPGPNRQAPSASANSASGGGGGGGTAGVNPSTGGDGGSGIAYFAYTTD